MTDARTRNIDSVIDRPLLPEAVQEPILRMNDERPSWPTLGIDEEEALTYRLE